MNPTSIPHLRRRGLAAAIGFALITCAPAYAQQGYEQPGSKASDFAPAMLLKGSNHTVDQNVTFQNFLPRFTIRSPYGVWEARGVEMLDIRVSELAAIGKLNQVSGGAEFKSALGRAVVKPVEVVGDLVTKPVDTAGNIVSGVGVMFGRVGGMVGSAAMSTSDRMSSDSKAVKTSIAGSNAAPPAGTAQPRTFIGDPLGYNKARRDWAQRLNIDPYTSNGPLSDKLSDVAKVTFAGTFAVELGVSAVAAPLHYGNQAYQQGTMEAYQLPPIDIQKKNDERLSAMGVDGARSRALGRNGYFTPTLQSALVLSLQSLGNVEGRADVVNFATNAISDVEARYVNNSVMLLSQYAKSTPLRRVRAFDHFIAGETRDGKLVIALPLDFVPWTEVVNQFATRADLKGGDRRILVSGAVSPRAKEQLTALGWNVQDKLVAAR